MVLYKVKGHNSEHNGDGQTNPDLIPTNLKGLNKKYECYTEKTRCKTCLKFEERQKTASVQLY